MGSCLSSPAVCQKPSCPKLNDDDKLISIVIDRPVPDDDGGAAKCRMSPSAELHSFGSKEEVFFDAQPSIEPEDEDEFFSVNGDLTPSSSPYSIRSTMRRSLSVASSCSREGTMLECKLTQTSVRSQRSLYELFCESDDEKQDDPREFKSSKSSYYAAFDVESNFSIWSSGRSYGGNEKVNMDRSRKSTGFLTKLLGCSPKSPTKYTSTAA